MRKLTAAQIAAMTATIGVYATTATRYGAPLLGLVAATASAYDDDELEEVVVTGTRPGGYDIVIYPRAPGGSSSSSSGGGGNPPAPVAQAPTNSQPGIQRKATRCALRYSVDINPPGRRGQAPGYTTEYVTTGYWWGTTNPTKPAPLSTNSATQRPNGDAEYFLIDGYTSRANGRSYVYTNNALYTANNRGITYEANLVNILAHEWSHQWDGNNSDEARATGLGNMAQQLYQQDGGDAGAPCNTAAPPRNGGTGGRK